MRPEMHGAKEVFQASDSSAVYKCGKADLGGGGVLCTSTNMCQTRTEFKQPNNDSRVAQ